MPDDRLKPRRLQTGNDRDAASDKSRRDRAIPEPWDADATGRYHDDPDALRAARAKRPTDERIERLEEKHDDLHAVVTETRVIVGKLDGKLDVLPDLIDEIRQAATERANVAHLAAIDEADAKKNRRERWTKVLGIFGSGGVLIEILHRMGVL